MTLEKLPIRPAGFAPGAELFRASETIRACGLTSEYLVRSYGLESVMGDDNLGIFLTDSTGRALDWSMNLWSDPRVLSLRHQHAIEELVVMP